jgi:hypothetical protein
MIHKQGKYLSNSFSDSACYKYRSTGPKCFIELQGPHFDKVLGRIEHRGIPGWRRCFRLDEKFYGLFDIREVKAQRIQSCFLNYEMLLLTTSMLSILRYCHTTRQIYL